MKTRKYIYTRRNYRKCKYEICGYCDYLNKEVDTNFERCPLSYSKKYSKGMICPYDEPIASDTYKKIRFRKFLKINTLKENK